MLESNNLMLRNVPNVMLYRLISPGLFNCLHCVASTGMFCVVLSDGNFVMAEESEFKTLVAKTQAMGEVMESVTKYMLSRDDKFDGLSVKVDRVSKTVEESRGSVEDIRNRMVTHGADAQNRKTQMGKISKSVCSQETEMQAVKQQVGALGKTVEGTSEMVKDVAKSMGKQEGDLDAIRRQIGQWCMESFVIFWYLFKGL